MSRSILAQRYATELQAICFDLDGTLYVQGPLRRLMFAKLMFAGMANPREALKTYRIITAYRKAQEALRGAAPCDVARAQIDLTCQFTGLHPESVRQCIALWFDQEPLPFLAKFLRPGLIEFLQTAKRRRIKLAVLSDYPAEAKLTAMGLRDYFDLIVSAQDPSVGCFKPSPNGLDCVAERLGIEKRHLLYIGDRPKVDAEAARRAGVHAVIVGAGSRRAASGWMQVRNFTELGNELGFSSPP